jgi:hypothetical protein
MNAAGEVHPVLALIAERLAAGGGPGAHGDGHRLAPAIEGGGMRGTITAGMALGVHERGLTPVFDDVYGSSAAAIGQLPAPEHQQDGRPKMSTSVTPASMARWPVAAAIDTQCLLSLTTRLPPRAAARRPAERAGDATELANRRVRTR